MKKTVAASFAFLLMMGMLISCTSSKYGCPARAAQARYMRR